MKKVLVVDDMAFMRRMLIKSISDIGLEIVGEASNGLIALEKCLELNPDIITMDINMPQMDGLEAAKQILKHKPDTKIVMISTFGLDEYVREAYSLGATDFIVKPFHSDIITSKFRKLA